MGDFEMSIATQGPTVADQVRLAKENKDACQRLADRLTNFWRIGSNGNGGGGLHVRTSDDVMVRNRTADMYLHFAGLCQSINGRGRDPTEALLQSVAIVQQECVDFAARVRADRAANPEAYYPIRLLEPWEIPERDPDDLPDAYVEKSDRMAAWIEGILGEGFNASGLCASRLSSDKTEDDRHMLEVTLLAADIYADCRRDDVPVQIMNGLLALMQMVAEAAERLDDAIAEKALQAKLKTNRKHASKVKRGAAARKAGAK
jgi:hypothetical protein